MVDKYFIRSIARRNLIAKIVGMKALEKAKERGVEIKPIKFDIEMRNKKQRRRYEK